MKTIWIIGMGHFGWRAYRGLENGPGDKRFVLVDPIEKNLQRTNAANCTLEKADGVSYLIKHLHKENPEGAPDWIIPAAPVHLAAEL
ncbi:MAG: potassium transporter, partial [Desulfobacterales bacterium]|nr:potassium transporter [Desulfobacterales bacterium]